MDTKICTKCKKEYPATPEYFTRNKSCRDGLHTFCKTCKRNQNRKWWSDNQEEISERRKEQYATDPDNRRKNLERSRQWREDNHEEVLEKKREYYRANREHDLKKSREWREANSEYKKEWDRLYSKANRKKIRKRQLAWEQRNRGRINANRRKQYRQDPTSRKVSNLRYEARKNALPDTMTEQDYIFMMEYWDNACAITGETDNLQIDHWIPLDSDNCPGTVPENMIPLSTSMNASKQNFDAKEWLEWKFGVYRASQILSRVNQYFELVEERQEESA